MNDTIRDDRKFRLVLPFEDLKASFVRGIYPQDIDGEVEINGNFLWMEWKEGQQSISGGSWLATLKRLRMSGNRGVLFHVSHSPAVRDQCAVCGAYNSGKVSKKDILGFQIFRLDSWLEGQESLIHQTTWLTGGPHEGAWNRLNRWLTEWTKMAEGHPNRFVTEFRKLKMLATYKIDATQKYL